MSKGTHYTSEFKREAVKLAQSSDRPTSQIAVEMGVKVNTLYNWVSIAMKDKTTPAASRGQKSKHSYQELESEIKPLNKALKRAEMEREILKKSRGVLCKPRAVKRMAYRVLEEKSQKE